MLPSIISIAQENGLIINKRTFNNKEVMAKCPFCHMDANNPRKYYLSLNPKENIYKCWTCKEYGGVLQFESLLTGKSFQEVKEKYFGKRKRKYHAAEKLSPKQLDKINWADIKREHYKEYKNSLDDIIAEWNEHLTKNRILAFAKLLVGIEMEKTQLVSINILNQGKEAQIPHLLTDVLEMYASVEWSNWALEARIIAAAAYKTARAENNQLENGLYYVLFSYNQYMQRTNKTKNHEGMNEYVS